MKMIRFDEIIKPIKLKSDTGVYMILAGLLSAIAGIFVIRLFFLQVIQHEHYVSLAQIEHVKRERVPAKRGEIYALNGEKPVKIVLNETVYTVFVDPVVILETGEASAIAKMMKEIPDLFFAGHLEK